LIKGPIHNLSISLCKMTPFWSHCSPSLPFRTDQADSTGNKSGNSRPRHHDLLPTIPLMDWWRGEGVFCMLGLYKRQSRAEEKEEEDWIKNREQRLKQNPKGGGSATGGELTKKINPETKAKTGGRTLETEKELENE